MHTIPPAPERLPAEREEGKQMAKRHGWLVGALQDAGYSQRDLARAWKIDDAVVSRFISTGKPDLTPERQMLLAQMLKMTNDQLLNRLFGGIQLSGVIRPKEEPAPASRLQLIRGDGPELEEAADLVQVEIKKAVDRLQSLLPGATVNITISYK